MFKRLIRKIIRWAQDDDYDTGSPESSHYGTSVRGHSKSNKSSFGNSIKSTSPVSNYSIDDTETGFNFVIYNASGGKIIQCWHYDKITDKQRSNLYIIHSDDDLATELSMIMTKESLSR